MGHRLMMLAAVALMILGPVEGNSTNTSALLPEPAKCTMESPRPVVRVVASLDKLDPLDQFLAADPQPERWTIGSGTLSLPAPGAFTDVFQMLQGQVAGARVSGSVNNYQIRIRNASAPPLVVLDGLRLYGYNDQAINELLMSIPPAAVEYIEVLKNIADAAIYGPGAGNGVIILHTLPVEDW